MPATPGLLMKALEGAYPARPPAESPTADAVVMLAGGIVRGVSPVGLQWGDSSNRFFSALDLIQADKARYLIITDGGSSDATHQMFGDLVHAEAVRRGIPETRIIQIGRVLTTEDEARQVAGLPNINDILLVTSAFHMRRAVLLFSAFGLKVEPFPTDQHHFEGYRRSQPFIPVADGYRETELALREFYGLAVYEVLLKLHPPAPRAGMRTTASAPVSVSGHP
jgi:uncharacterized SAM-binding protein YcdF (DUF218 family)